MAAGCGATPATIEVAETVGIAVVAATTTVVGSGGLTVWLKSSAPDTDLQVTLSEVTADGKETFIQNGYLRASERALAKPGAKTMLGHPSTLLEPVPTFTSKDAKPMPRGKFEKVTIPLYYSGHAFRAGTRIRITLAAPNGAQPVWSFGEALTGSKVSVAYGAGMPSSLVLPVVPGVAVTTAQPACPSLRNMPCRTYTALVNAKG